MPEWLWSIVVGIVVMGLIAALRQRDSERLKNIEEKLDKLMPLIGKAEYIEKEVGNLRAWQESEGVGYIRATDELKVRFDIMDRNLKLRRP